MNEKTLLANPTATIYLDGLIFLLPNSKSKLCRALIHTGAAHHALQIEVKKDGSEEVLFPTEQLTWDGSPSCLNAAAPFWLYVDSGSGRPDNFSTSFHKSGDLGDERSFGHVIDFEKKLYDHGLNFRPAPPVAEFNFAHGTFYSAQNGEMTLKAFAQNEAPKAASSVEVLTSSVVVGVDIDSKSDESGDKYLVLEQTKPSEGCTPRKEVFRLKLEEGTRYVVKLLNIPVPGHHMSHDDAPEAHFLKYYDLFSLKEGEKMFFLKMKEEPRAAGGPPPDANFTMDSPPCNVGQGSTTVIS